MQEMPQAEPGIGQLLVALPAVNVELVVKPEVRHDKRLYQINDLFLFLR